MLLMVQSIAQNIALSCGALFAGGSVYISPAEDPVTGERGTELAGVYLLTAHPRLAIFQSVFGMLASTAGMLTRGAGGAIRWAVGGIITGMATLVQLFVALPKMRRLGDAEFASNAERVSRLFDRLAKMHAAISLASLAALFIFILHT